MAKERGLIENFWPSFFRQSKEQLKTPRDPFAQMLQRLDQPIGSTNTQTKLIKERVGAREIEKGQRFGKDNQNFDPNQPALRQVEKLE